MGCALDAMGCILDVMGCSFDPLGCSFEPSCEHFVEPSIGCGYERAHSSFVEAVMAIQLTGEGIFRGTALVPLLYTNGIDHRFIDWIDGRVCGELPSRLQLIWWCTLRRQNAFACAENEENKRNIFHLLPVRHALSVPSTSTHERSGSFPAAMSLQCQH